jgi:hypothetical protein
MTFCEQTVSTFIGAFVAFIFSIALFYFTEKWRNKTSRKVSISNLLHEIEYNIRFLKDYKDDFEKMIRQITVGDAEIHTMIRHYKLQRLFLQDAFSQGLLYQYLTSEDINDLDTMLNYFSIEINRRGWNMLNDYRNKKVDQKDALSYFQFDVEQIDKYIKVQERIHSKLKKI